MRPEQLRELVKQHRELVKQHFEMFLGDKFISTTSDIAEKGGSEIYIKRCESRDYLVDCCGYSLTDILVELGYTVNYHGDSRLRQEEYIVVGWEK